MKKIEIEIENCKQCPFYRKISRSSIPACGHHVFSNEIYAAKELPHDLKTDPYNGSIYGVFIGVIPDWCPV